MQIEDARVLEMIPLVTPRGLKESLPLSAAVRDLVLRGREEIKSLLTGQDRKRLLVVVGPCSIHDPRSAEEYAIRLRKVAEQTRDNLLIVMRTYFEKPRTVAGWKGLVSDPYLDGSCEIEMGLRLARSILLKVGEVGLLCGTEFLDPIVPQYVADLVSWVAIGARTTESQTHRQMASGLSMPVGFKNSTDGSLQNAMNAVLSARHSHAFLGINTNGLTTIVKTAGNPEGHVVLRGGNGKSNYHENDIAEAVECVAREGIQRGVLVDCSHDNSGKDHTRQASVFRDVINTFVKGQSGILGVMVESNILPGKQSWKENCPPEYGISITDSCIGWEETERLLFSAAEKISKG